MILVEYIKNPNIEIPALSKLLTKKGIKMHPNAIYNFFAYHGLQKKFRIQADSTPQGIHE